MTYEKGLRGIFAPNYYKSFKCIADKCRHSCCIDWEIPIDTKSLKKYRQMPDIRKSIHEEDGEACFQLLPNGRCPHLNASGLCDIIISHGEEYLADICRLHPRFINDVGDGVRELGIAIVCEEACRIILECDEPFTLIEVHDASLSSESVENEAQDFDPIPERNKIISKAEACDTLEMASSSLSEEYSLSMIYQEDAWLERFLELEILDTGWEETLRAARNATATDADEYEKYYLRLLKYFVFRHVSVAENRDGLRARLGFALLSVKIIKYLFEREAHLSKEKLFELARRYSSEIEYSEENTAELIFEFEAEL